MTVIVARYLFCPILNELILSKLILYLVECTIRWEGLAVNQELIKYKPNSRTKEESLP